MTYAHLVFLWILISVADISDDCCSYNQNTHLLSSNFSSENHAVDEIQWKNMVRIWQATNDDMAHAYGVLDNKG